MVAVGVLMGGEQQAGLRRWKVRQAEHQQHRTGSAAEHNHGDESGELPTADPLSWSPGQQTVQPEPDARAGVQQAGQEPGADPGPEEEFGSRRGEAEQRCCPQGG